MQAARKRRQQQVASAKPPTPIVRELAFACGFAQRAKGLLRTRPTGRALVIVPCRDVHTAGMRYPLDLAFVSKDGVVIEAYRQVRPWRRLRCSGATATIERFSSEEPWFAKGDRLGFTSVSRSRRRGGRR